MPFMRAPNCATGPLVGTKNLNLSTGTGVLPSAAILEPVQTPLRLPATPRAILQFGTSYNPEPPRSTRIAPNLKRDWVPSRRAFDRLLAWLDGGIDSGGQNYVDMRRRLVRYFERKHCFDADALADDTLNRVSRRLEEEGTITGAAPAQYCHIVAKFVLLEHVRQIESRVRHAIAVDRPLDAKEPSGDTDSQQPLLECLDRCLNQLDPDEALLILEYYRGEQRAKIEQRRRLAAELELSPNALSIRACRIRDKLEACITRCRGKGERATFRRILSKEK
jgi:DNA-directed RNA polymerase specialized sigma24 family protein